MVDISWGRRRREQHHGGTSAEHTMGEFERSILSSESRVLLINLSRGSSNELWFHTIQISKTDIEVHLEAQLGIARWGLRLVSPFSSMLSTLQL